MGRLKQKMMELLSIRNEKNGMVKVDCVMQCGGNEIDEGDIDLTGKVAISYSPPTIRIR